MGIVHFIDGKWVREEYLKISAFDLSVLRGFGIFDFLRTYNYKPFRLQEHLTRLFNSAKITGIIIPATKSEIEKIIYTGIEKNKKVFNDFNIRLLVTGGVGVDSVTPGNSSLVIIYGKAVNYPQEYYTRGVCVITYPTVRTVPEAKTLNYLMGIMALQKAKKAGAIEAIYVDEEGKIYEGVTSNTFFIKDNTLYTSQVGVLAGITREVVINLAKKIGMKVVLGDVFLKDLSHFEEAFISASNKEIMPVVKFDTKKIGNGNVGLQTQLLIKHYRSLLE